MRWIVARPARDIKRGRSLDSAPLPRIVKRMRALALAFALLALSRVEGLPPQEKPSLRERLEAAVSASRIKDGRAGVLVHSARDGRAVYALHERDPFLLASNTKLLTTAAAL